MTSTVVASLKWRRWSLVGEIATAAIAMALLVSDVASAGASSAYTLAKPNGLLISLAVLAALPVGFRRLWPLLCLSVTTSAVFALGALHASAGAGLFCMMLCLYTVASWGSRRAAISGLVLANTSLAGLAVLQVPYFDHLLALMSPVCATVAWAIGFAMRRQRLNRDQAVTAALQAQRSRAQAAEKAVFAERLRLAGDLNHVVSRDLGIISAEAAQLQQRQEEQPHQLRSALKIIEDASRAALDDLRRMLMLLRADDPPETAAGIMDARPDQPPSGSWLRGTRLDIIVAVGLAVSSMINAYVPDPSIALPYAAPNEVLAGLALAAPLALAVRRRWPIAVFAVCLLSSSIIGAANWDADHASFCTFVALYTVARWCKPLTIAVCCSLVWVAPFVVSSVAHRPLNLASELFGLPLFIPVVLGLVMKQWNRDQEQALSDALDAEHAAAAAAQRAVFAERLRIAREMHDVVSHTLSVIAVQAGTARYLLASQPQMATPAIAAIEQASRAAFEELRSMQTVLQSGATEHSAIGPAPLVADLGVLVADHEAAHGPVAITIDQELERAPLSVQVTSYRLVQEALTNIRKHAPGANASITMSIEGKDVVIQIENTATAAPPRQQAPGGGHGLAGIRERVDLYRGIVRTDRTTSGGFLVHATLPGVITEHP